MKYEISFKGQIRFLRDWDHLVEIVNDVVKNQSFAIKKTHDDKVETFFLRNSADGLVDQYTGEIVDRERLEAGADFEVKGWMPQDFGSSTEDSSLKQDNVK